MTPIVRNVANGLKKCRGRSFRFPNFIRIPLLVKIIHRKSSAIEFAQAALLSFLFSFRAPSGNIQLVRYYSSDAADAFSPHPEKALIGVRTIAGAPFLIA